MGRISILLPKRLVMKDIMSSGMALASVDDGILLLSFPLVLTSHLFHYVFQQGFQMGGKKPLNMKLVIHYY